MDDLQEQIETLIVKTIFEQLFECTKTLKSLNLEVDDLPEIWASQEQFTTDKAKLLFQTNTDQFSAIFVRLGEQCKNIANKISGPTDVTRIDSDEFNGKNRVKVDSVNYFDDQESAENFVNQIEKLIGNINEAVIES